MAEVLIIGLGNILMQDEGIGVRAVELLEANYELSDEVEIIDGGTTGTELLEPMRECKHLIVADTINTGAKPGTLVKLTDEQVPAFFQTKISNHQLGLSDLLAILKVTDESPESVTILGMVPYDLNNTLGLSKESHQRLDDMVNMLVEELHAHGYHPKKREQPIKSFWAEQTRIFEKEESCA